MKFFVSFAIVISVFAISTHAQTNQFNVNDLSQRSQIAYGNLLTANQFEDTKIGYIGIHSQLILSFGIILKDENADVAFKSLFEKATTAGRLYAISGIFYTDYEYFKSEVNKLRLSKIKVHKQSGCLVYEAPISNLVESKAENVAIIGSGESLEQYLAGNGRRSYVLDIANGGIPASFKHFAERQLKLGNKLWRKNTLPLE